MTATELWILPVPSTALLGSGAVFEIRSKRDVAIRFAYEAKDDSRLEEALVFHGVEAFKCIYYLARGEFARKAYDKLVDCGRTAWLDEISENLRRNAGSPEGLLHLMINFDDGPAYEFLCRSYSVERKHE